MPITSVTRKKTFYNVDTSRFYQWASPTEPEQSRARSRSPQQSLPVFSNRLRVSVSYNFVSSSLTLLRIRRFSSQGSLILDRKVFTTLHFLRNLQIGPNKLECYIKVGWKCLSGTSYVSYGKTKCCEYTPRGLPYRVGH